MKFKTEKALHEVIRDLPDAMKIEEACEAGQITPFEALKAIVNAWDAEIERAAEKINQNWNEVI